jgi:hypothetical protein
VGTLLELHDDLALADRDRRDRVDEVAEDMLRLAVA